MGGNKKQRVTRRTRKSSGGGVDNQDKPYVKIDYNDISSHINPNIDDSFCIRVVMDVINYLVDTEENINENYENYFKYLELYTKDDDFPYTNYNVKPLIQMIYTAIKRININIINMPPEELKKLHELDAKIVGNRECSFNDMRKEIEREATAEATAKVATAEATANAATAATTAAKATAEAAATAEATAKAATAEAAEATAKATAKAAEATAATAKAATAAAAAAAAAIIPKSKCKELVKQYDEKVKDENFVHNCIISLMRISNKKIHIGLINKINKLKKDQEKKDQEKKDQEKKEQEKKQGSKGITGFFGFKNGGSHKRTVRHKSRSYHLEKTRKRL